MISQAHIGTVVDFKPPWVWDILPYPKSPWQPCRQPSCADPACLGCQGKPGLDPDGNPVLCAHQDACTHAVTFGYRPLSTVLPAHAAMQDPAIRVFCKEMARQVSKTTSEIADIWAALTAPNDAHGPPTVAIGADTYEHVYLVFDRMEWQIAQSPALQGIAGPMNRARLLLRINPGKWNGGATLHGLSGQAPESWSGFTLSHFFPDEAQYIPDAALFNIQPALSARRALISASGVCELGPETQWWRSFCLRAHEHEPGYAYVQAPIWVAPWHNPRWIEDQRRSMPEWAFKARYLAEWSEASGCPFSNIPAMFHETLQYAPPQPNKTYIGGLDVAAEGDDWTVLTIGDAITGRIAHCKRYGGTLRYQEEQVAADAVAYQARIACDTQGMGKPWAETIRSKGVSVIEYPFSAISKAHLVQTLQRAIEAERIKSPVNLPLRRELEEFRSQGVTATGIVKYGAPTGYHDDMVISLGLFAHLLMESDKFPRMTQRAFSYVDEEGVGVRRPDSSRMVTYA